MLLEKLPSHKDFELHGRALLHYFYSWRPRLSLSPSSSSYYKLRAPLSGRPTHMVSRESHRGIDNLGVGDAKAWHRLQLRAVLCPS